MPASRRNWLLAALVDAVLLMVSFAIAFRLRLDWPPPQANYESFLMVAPVLLVTCALTYFGFGLYVADRISLSDLLKSIVAAESALFFVTLALTFWLRAFAFPRSVIVIAFVVHVITAGGWRLSLWAYRRRGAGPRRVVVVAGRAESRHIVQRFFDEPHGYFKVLCVAEPDDVLTSGVAGLECTDLLVIGSSVDRETRDTLLRLALKAGKAVQLLPDLGDILVVGSSLGRVGDVPILEVSSLGLSPLDQAAKRVLDLVLVIPMIALAAIPALLVCAATKVLSPGPVLYNQERLGLSGRPFTLLKFRTMVPDAEQKTGPVLSTQNDPRITPLGRFLRKTRLDELPQFWNVLRGDMSLVGPRPERAVFEARFADEMPDYPLRHLVAPGITGLAQVMGKYETTPLDKLRFDLTYIRHYSVWLDLRIMLLTLRTVLTTDGSNADVGTSDRVRGQVTSIMHRSFSEVAAGTDEPASES